MGMEAERFFAGLPPFDPSKSIKDVRALTHWVDWLSRMPLAAEGGGVAGAVVAGGAGSGGGVGGSSGGGGVGAGLPLPGSGAGCCWLDCCVKLAFLDRGTAANGSWYMPSIRLVQTVGRAPP